MTTYTFSQLTSGQSIVFNPLSDVIFFDTYVSAGVDVTVRPAELLINSTASGVQFAVGGKSIVLSGIVLDQLGVSSTTGAHNVTFSGTGILLVGEGTTGTGGDGDNTLNGGAGNDALIGLGGKDILNGLAGADVMVGGTGDDTYFVDNVGDIVSETDSSLAGGIDTVKTTISYALPALVENLVLLGTADIDGTGNQLANTITGNSGDNVIDGAVGADMMIGGNGNDEYFVDNVGDKVVETNASLTQIDTVNSTLHYVLQPYVENLNLIGTAAVNGIGNTRSNVLNGNAAANTLNGGIGADTMKGGDGNDVYFVDNVGDVVIETNTSTSQVDMVASTLSYTLGANVETLRLLGSASINGTGNGTANVIYANSGNNVIDGGAGSDTVSYADVNLFTVGATNVSTATVTTSAEYGVIVDLAISGAQDTVGSGIDTLISIEKIVGSSYDDDLYGNSGTNTLDGGGGADVLVGRGGNDTYVVDGADLVIEQNGSIEGIDTVQASVSYRLTANVENLVLTGSARNGTGNNLDNQIVGNGGANVLDGRGGADRMDGGAGNDIYVIDNLGDQVVDSAGVDQINTFINFDLSSTSSIENLRLMGNNALNGSGNLANNVIWANSADNVVNGGAHTLGGDTLSYQFGATAGLTVDLSLTTAQVTGGSGIDTISNFENLTGSDYNDVLSGNDAANVLDGLGGIDTVSYARSSAGVTINLTAQTATATVGSATIVDKVRNFENVTGSEFNDRIIGDLGDNVLNGGNGTDTVSYEHLPAGQTGVIVDLSVTTAQETEAAGRDTLLGFENLVGSANNDTLSGSATANKIEGGAGDDIIYGGGSSDTLIGGAGADMFVYRAASESSSPTGDVIADFTVGVDDINVAAIDAIPSTVGDNAFAFVGTAAFTAAGQIRVEQVGADTLVSFNLDTNLATAEMSFILQAVASSTVSAVDFVL